MRILAAIAACAAVFALGGSAAAQNPVPAPAPNAASFVPPPRTIADIAAILDQQKPDAVKRAKTEAEANAPDPAAGAEASPAYYRRCQARAALGRSAEAIADCEKAVSLGGDYNTYVSRVQQILDSQYRQIGDFKRSAAILESMDQKFSSQARGRLPGVYQRSAIAALQLGDVNRAETYVKKLQAFLAQSRNAQNFDMLRSSWEASYEDARARVAEQRGRYAEAEVGYRKVRALMADAMERSKSWTSAPPRSTFESGMDFALAFEGRTKARQGRLVEGEIDMRRALLSRLKAEGKYNFETAQVIIAFITLLTEQARWSEAEKLARTVIDIYQAMGLREDALLLVVARSQLAATLYSQRRFDEAKVEFDTIDNAVKDWDPKRSGRFRYGWSRIFTLYLTGETVKGIPLAREFLARERARASEKHPDTALAHAMLATGLTIARQDAEAMAEYRQAVPILVSAERDNDGDEAGGLAAAEQRAQAVLEVFMTLLSRSPEAGAPAEAFQIAERIRRRSVEQALNAASARAAARDPALAELARREQDLDKQARAQLATLTNMLALPPEERDDKAIRELQTEIGTLRGERRTARREIEKRFPDYADLVSPKPSSVDDIRAALKPGEAFLSFYLARRDSFVWALPKEGPVAFARIAENGTAIEKRVRQLREALEPSGATIGDIAPFDVARAHELFNLLLKPVETGWKSAKSLIVVSNGALGLLPLSLLPVEPAAVADAEPAFVNYRQVKWLARTHAVTAIPSASAMRTLRALPAGGKRETLIAFGDPYFNARQAAEAARGGDSFVVASATTRGAPLALRAAPRLAGVDSAELGLLPRLPDTADELRSIAGALGADPAKSIHLGKSANTRSVKTADLSRYRIVAFATHGLVPGELDGLTQPALALTAPDIAGVDGDGLLRMEDILGLKLNADWVVLSACNTGAGAGAGAEAASGLGRAFFYAGTRALLVTNWSVHSASARTLVTDLFRRQATDPKITRGEALREAMMALLDGPGFTDASGKTVYSYGHPLFWAPYSIIGDGSGG